MRKLWIIGVLLIVVLVGCTDFKDFYFEIEGEVINREQAVMKNSTDSLVTIKTTDGRFYTFDKKSLYMVANEGDRVWAYVEVKGCYLNDNLGLKNGYVFDPWEIEDWKILGE